MALVLMYKRDVLTAANLALIVGTILAVINHYDMFLSGKLIPRRVLQLLITYVVPFFVSLVTSAFNNRHQRVTRIQPIVGMSL